MPPHVYSAKGGLGFGFCCLPHGGKGFGIPCLPGRMCEWAMQVEEKFLEVYHVLGWARIIGVTLSSDFPNLLPC